MSSSSGREAQPKAEPAGQQGLSPREMLAKVYATAGTRDWDAVEALIHPNFVLYEANSLPFAGEWRGKDAL